MKGGDKKAERIKDHRTQETQIDDPSEYLSMSRFVAWSVIINLLGLTLCLHHNSSIRFLSSRVVLSRLEYMR